jgi:hypothetical protein
VQFDTTLTVALPREVVAELRRLPRERGQSLDEVVAAACRAYVRPPPPAEQYRRWLLSRFEDDPLPESVEEEGEPGAGHI